MRLATMILGFWGFSYLAGHSMQAGATDLQDQYQAGKAFGQARNAGLSQGISTDRAQTLVPGFNSAPPETANYGLGDLASPRQAKISGCGAAELDPNSRADQECIAVNLIQRAPSIRPQFVIDPDTDPTITRGDMIIADPSAYAGDLEGTFSECQTRTVTTPAIYETAVCNEYRVASTQTCEKVLSLACDPIQDGCDAGGIVANSWAGDMAVNWAPSGTGDYNLTFGTIADNYWGNGTHDRTLTFQVKDMSLITKFALTRAAFDDWLWVKVNGTTVYVGPYGGDRLYVIDAGTAVGGYCSYNDWGRRWDCFQYIAWSDNPIPAGSYLHCGCQGWDGCTWYCNNDGYPGTVKYGPGDNQYGGQELSTSWNIGLNIDIKPYLIEGVNTVWMRTIVAGGGEGAVIFTTRQTCPRNCRDVWSNDCATFEARAQ